MTSIANDIDEEAYVNEFETLPQPTLRNNGMKTKSCQPEIEASKTTARNMLVKTGKIAEERKFTRFHSLETMNDAFADDQICDDADQLILSEKQMQ